MSERLEDLIYTPSLQEIEEQTAWIESQISEIGKPRLYEMAKRASEVRRGASAALSGYLVGSVVLTKSGDTYEGVNVEIDVAPLGSPYAIHAEGSGIWNSVVGGEVQKSGRRFVKAITVSHLEGSGENWSGPCGICLQDGYEFSDNALVVIADVDGNIQHITSLRILMPRPFTPTHLGIE